MRINYSKFETRLHFYSYYTFEQLLLLANIIAHNSKSVNVGLFYSTKKHFVKEVSLVFRLNCVRSPRVRAPRLFLWNRGHNTLFGQRPQANVAGQMVTPRGIEPRLPG